MRTARKQTVTRWTAIGDWHKCWPSARCPWPSMVPLRRERECYAFHLFQADYYGHGMHLYLECASMLQFEGQPGPGPVPGGWQTGNTEYIAGLCSRYGVKVPA